MHAVGACKTAYRFFGKGNANFVAIDGTEYTKSIFDMIIFYAGAYSCEGSIGFSNKSQGSIDITYKDRFMDQGNPIIHQ